jgi:hypothetical protein
LLLADEGEAKASGGNTTRFPRRIAPPLAPLHRKVTAPAYTQLPPQLRPPTRPEIEDRELAPFDWACLVDRYVHEFKVAIAEALDWIGQPLSAKELWYILDMTTQTEYQALAYHARTLQRMGLTVEAAYREARGATEVYYLPVS